MYSFYRPTEGRRLRRPPVATYRDGLPAHRWSPIQVLNGPDIEQLHRCAQRCYGIYLLKNKYIILLNRNFVHGHQRKQLYSFQIR